MVYDSKDWIRIQGVLFPFHYQFYQSQQVDMVSYRILFPGAFLIDFVAFSEVFPH